MRNSWCRFLCAALLAAALPALAAFQYATCPTAGYGSAIPVNIGAQEFDPKPENPPGGATDGTRYHLNTSSKWKLLVNPNVTRIRPYLGFFMTESGYDNLRVIHQGGIATYTGNLNAVDTPVLAGGDWLPTPQFDKVRAVDVRWTSDVSVANYLPPHLNQVDFQCSATPAAPGNGYDLLANTRYDGLLIASGDIIYVRFEQSANTPLLLTLDSKATTAGADFDLYVSTSNPTPDNGSFTWRGYSSLASEALDIPVSPVSRTLYIGVRAFSGAGHFTLHALQQHTSERLNLTVCPLEFTPTAAQQAVIRSFFQSGSARLLAASAGNTFIKGFNVTAQKATCEASCSICLKSSGNVSNAGPSPDPEGCGRMTLGGGNWDDGAAGGWVFAHEAGHSCYGLPDEYKPPPAGSSTPMYCGHTIMSNHGYARFFCSIAHCRDGHEFDSSACDPSSDSNWRRFVDGGHRHFGMDYDVWDETPDPTDYFNNTNLLNQITVSF
jgi:hypothetical protein